MLRRLGFERLANFGGGFAEYQRQGQPVETGGA
jgi:3-mercaptopyruvate sulfurtransferase SseA